MSTSRRAARHLVEHLGHEALAAEPGLDAHHQQRVEVRQHLDVGLDRRARLDRQPGPGAGRAQVARPGATGSRGGLDVEGHVVRAGLGVAERPPVGVVDHQVAVERQVGRRAAAPSPPAGRGSGWARSGRPSRRRAASRRRRAQPTAAASSARRAKSADRMLGAIIGCTAPGYAAPSPASGVPVRGGHDQPLRGSAGAAQQGEEHRVGAVPVRPQLHARARRRGRARPAGSGRASSCSTLRACLPQRRPAHDARGLGQVRRAGHVGDHAAGPHGAQRRGEQLALQLGQRRRRPRGGGASAPPAAGAARRARCTARRRAPGRRRRVGQRRRSRPSAACTVTGSPSTARRTSSARCSARLDGVAAAPPSSATSAPSSAALPPGPAHRSSQRPSSPVERGARSGPARPAGCPRPARRPGPRATASSSPGSPRPARCTPYGEYGAGSPPVTSGQLLGGDLAGPGEQVHRGAGVVGGERRVELLGGRRRARRANACAIHRGWACANARWPTGSSSAAGASSLDPGLLVALADPAQHRVDEARRPARPRPPRTSSTVVATAACGGHPGAQQLVGAQAQGVEHRRARPGRAAGRRTRRSRRRAGRGRAACRSRARWPARRRGRAAGAGAGRRAGRGWRTRRARAPRSAARSAASRAGSSSGGRGGPGGRAGGPLRRGSGRRPSGGARRVAGRSSQQLAGLDAHAAGPVGGGHRALADGPHLAELDRRRRRCRRAPAASRRAARRASSSGALGRPVAPGRA